MKLLIASLILSLLASFSAVGMVGQNLGALFALVAVVVLLVPLIAAAADTTLAALGGAVVASIAASVSLSLLLYRDAIELPELIRAAFLLVAVATALAGLTRLLCFARLPATLASAMVILLGIAWLAWPIWLSPWLASPGSDAFVDRLVAVHPLMALNAMLPESAWTQNRLMYELTALGQDVSFNSPRGTAASVWLHVAIGLLASLLPIWKHAELRPRPTGEGAG